MNPTPHTQREIETEYGIVVVREPAEPEKPRVEPTPRSYGIIEMIEQASMEQEEFEGRIIRAKAAKGLQLEPEEMEELDRLEIIQARRLKMATPKEREEELAQDAWAAEVLEHSMREAEIDEDAKTVAEPKEKMKIEEKPEKQEKAEDGGPEKPDSM